MKTRVIAIMCCVALALSCVAIAGCGGNGGSSEAADLSNSAYVGTWKATKATFQGEEVAIEEVLTDGDFILVLKEDGSVDVNAVGEESTAVWSETSDGIKVKGDEINTTFKDADGMLETDIIGMHLFFEKQA